MDPRPTVALCRDHAEENADEQLPLVLLLVLRSIEPVSTLNGKWRQRCRDDRIRSPWGNLSVALSLRTEILLWQVFHTCVSKYTRTPE